MIFNRDTAESCSDYDGKPSFTQIILAIFVGLIFAIALHYRLKQIRDQKIIPRVRLSRQGHHTPKLERFSHYVGNGIFYSITHTDHNLTIYSACFEIILQ